MLDLLKIPLEFELIAGQWNITKIYIFFQYHAALFISMIENVLKLLSYKTIIKLMWMKKCSTQKHNTVELPAAVVLLDNVLIVIIMTPYSDTDLKRPWSTATITRYIHQLRVCSTLVLGSWAIWERLSASRCLHWSPKGLSNFKHTPWIDWEWCIWWRL